MAFDYSDFLNIGKVAENKLAAQLTKLTSTSKWEDISGVDLKVAFTFDVKKAKKIRRRDMFPSYTQTWIEFRNVKGDYGSICRENLDFFVYEMPDSWVVKSREDALNLFREMSKNPNGDYKQLKELTYSTQIELYQPYRRHGREDVIMLVEFDHPLWETKLVIKKT